MEWVGRDALIVIGFIAFHSFLVTGVLMTLLRAQPVPVALRRRAGSR